MLSEGLRGHVHILCDNAHSNAIPLILIIRFMLMLGSTSALSCFCNEELCTDEMCKNKDCIVGIQRKGDVMRTCGKLTNANNQSVFCTSDVERWHEVCSCPTNYCNSFRFFRRHIAEYVPSYHHHVHHVYGDQEDIDTFPNIYISTQNDEHNELKPVPDTEKQQYPTRIGKRMKKKSLVNRDRQYTAATLCFIFILIMAPALITGTLFWFAFYSYC